MRSDMHKVIVERPRWGSRGHYPRGSLRPRTPEDIEGLPSREAMGRGYAFKNLNENLQPLVRYLRSSLGRPWSAIYADIAANLSVRSAVQKHVLDHLRDYVYMRVRNVNGELVAADRYGREVSLSNPARWRRTSFYVCPDTGLLRELCVERPPEVARDPDVYKLSSSAELRRIRGVWYRVEFEMAAGHAFDLLTRQKVFNARHAVSKRQLSKRELVEIA